MMTETPHELPEDWADWDTAQLAEEIAGHNRRYWDDAIPTVSDYDYDRLVERLRRLDPNAAVLQAMGPSGTARVGRTIRHARSMLSLDKAYDEATLLHWAEKFEGALVMTPKIDGVACSIRYDASGALVVAATRGDGSAGEDITENVRRIPSVPTQIDTTEAVEVRGEVYLPLSAFAKLGGDVANPRNSCAGALKQKDPEKSAKVGLQFFAYDVLMGDDETGTGHFETELDKFALVERWRFTPVAHERLERGEIQAGYEGYVARRDALDFEIDGVVFKADLLSEHVRLGATGHHPRYAIAYKLQGESARTTLEGVEWSVSRTGVITPVGLVAPVSLSGATVTRISLHNWGLVQAKGLSIGAEVVAMRRGGVIPHLESVVTPGQTPVSAPKTCPSCGGLAVLAGDLVRCPNKAACPDQAVGGLNHYAKAAGIDGFGQIWLETLVEAGLLKAPVDLYTLTPKQLLRFDRMGAKLAQKLVDNVNGARTLPLATFLRALGISDLGRTASKVLAKHFLSLSAVRAARPSELVALPKFGELLAARIVDGLSKRAALVDALLEHVTVTDEVELEVSDASVNAPFEGLSFLFTGTLTTMRRDEAKAAVEARGGKAASGVSGKLSYLVVGNAGKAGGKVAKAEKAGVKVVTEGAFGLMLKGEPEVVAQGSDEGSDAADSPIQGRLL